MVPNREPPPNVGAALVAVVPVEVEAPKENAKAAPEAEGKENAGAEVRGVEPEADAAGAGAAATAASAALGAGAGLAAGAYRDNNSNNRTEQQRTCMEGKASSVIAQKQPPKTRYSSWATITTIPTCKHTVVMENLWNDTAWARPALGRYENAGGRRTREIEQCRVYEALTLNPIEKHSPTHARSSVSYRGATCAPSLGGRGACGASTSARGLFVGDLEASSHLRDRDGPHVRKNLSHTSRRRDTLDSLH